MVAADASEQLSLFLSTPEGRCFTLVAADLVEKQAWYAALIKAIEAAEAGEGNGAKINRLSHKKSLSSAETDKMRDSALAIL